MIHQKFLPFVLFFCLCLSTAFAQKNVTTVGLQFKPIFPLSFLGTGTQSQLEQGVQFDFSLKSGFAAGMVVRRGMTDLLSFETGINYVKRTFTLDITDANFNTSSDFRMIAYEIPASLLAYIQLGEKLYMNASMGASADMFASSLETKGEGYEHRSKRKNVLQPAVIANIGWEYRTVKSGYWYLGASYHRPFNYIYNSQVQYQRAGKDFIVEQRLLGNYLTLDLRYFFHEDPDNLKRKRVYYEN
ncbi:MAG: hypothetical protein KBB38_08915 [Bacteroidia bacterium]|jgi:hypothetical protein|nr:hypothetical protein [Bacteroidia bacterium]MBP7270409.1 hypothetical protein [Bacteroidia bacterium]MBP7728864.1 hypothetical protein [Bacteroidia bacterium]MBP7773288.1 hypothetical protein [Bacteroidia bacterium]